MALVSMIGAAGLLLAACGTTEEPTEDAAQTSAPTSEPSGGGATINVPADHETIQAAVDAAAPGDLILIEPGVYEEAVDVTIDELTIRGLDRNEVILDGGFELENGIRVLGATGVAVENMTARNYTTNGFYWTGVEGYRGSYLTAYRNGDYGIYAFDSVKGQLDHSFASGSPDAGFYIGQCYPCEAVLDDVISEYNGLGYSGTNSGGDLLVVNSVFRHNRAGIVPNTGSYELCYPERESTIVGNTVYDNNQPDTPAIGAAIDAMGNGIIMPGGVLNVVERNYVEDHDIAGIALVPFPETEASDLPPDRETWDQPCSETRDDPVTSEEIPEEIYWQPIGNTIRDNVVRDSRLADLVVLTLEADVSTLENCWTGNDVTTTAPAGLQELAPCEGEGSAGEWIDDLVSSVTVALLASDKPEPVDYQDAPTPEPPAQPNMPDAATAPARPATDVPFAVDLDAIAAPTAIPSS
jgi:hypothetical protein